MDNPNLDADTLSKLRTPYTKGLSSVQTGVGASDTTMQSLQHSGTEQDVPLETVLEATGQLDLDEQGD